jgi:hypothetical protein
VAVHMFFWRPLTPLSEPLPFFAYPFLAASNPHLATGVCS